jgi:tRNA-modifying protein YgfZ
MGKCEVNKHRRVAEKRKGGQVVAMPLRLDRALIRVSGPDARNFLNHLLTQNLELIAGLGVQYSALLTPQGKIVTDVMIWDDDQSLILEVDRASGADLLKRLTMYKLRAQVLLEDISDQIVVVWSPEPFEHARQDPRLERLGWRGVAPVAAHVDGTAPFEARRIALGVPDLARDAASEEVFALEALLEELNGVDFQKGCFVGQENVSRMKRRATTRRKFCPVVFEGAPPAFGTPIRAGEAELGSVRSGIEGRAIALLRLDRALDVADKGEQLFACDKPIRLDPPNWLILPPRGA